jgi:hypothetical protein
MMKRALIALTLAASALAGVTFAQENATFILRSGERLQGQLMDMGGAGFTVQVNGQQRQIATNDMAVIDFTGGGATQADWDRLGSGSFVVMRDGQVINGQLTDVGGSAPLRLSINAGGSNRDVTSNDVARIVMARPADTAGTSGSQGATPGVTSPSGFNVSAQQPCFATGMTVRRGETLGIQASGEISYGPGRATPAGSTSDQNPANPVPNAPTGALIGRIGNGAAFLIGSQNQIQAPANGQLFLCVNDGQMGDNSGAFQVQVTRQGRR